MVPATTPITLTSTDISEIQSFFSQSSSLLSEAEIKYDINLGNAIDYINDRIVNTISDPTDEQTRRYRRSIVLRTIVNLTISNPLLINRSAAGQSEAIENIDWLERIEVVNDRIDNEISFLNKESADEPNPSTTVADFTLFGITGC